MISLWKSNYSLKVQPTRYDRYPNNRPQNSLWNHSVWTDKQKLTNNSIKVWFYFIGGFQNSRKCVKMVKKSMHFHPIIQFPLTHLIIGNFCNLVLCRPYSHHSPVVEYPVVIFNVLMIAWNGMFLFPSKVSIHYFAQTLTEKVSSIATL